MLPGASYVRKTGFYGCLISRWLRHNTRVSINCHVLVCYAPFTWVMVLLPLGRLSLVSFLPFHLDRGPTGSGVTQRAGSRTRSLCVGQHVVRSFGEVNLPSLLLFYLDRGATGRGVTHWASSKTRSWCLGQHVVFLLILQYFLLHWWKPVRG